MQVLTDDDLQEQRTEIYKWLNLPAYIADLEEERNNFSKNYYQEHSFYAHTVFTEHFGIVTEAPKVEDVAINLADAQITMNKVIKRKKEQYRLFKTVLSYLPANKLKSLESKYLSPNSYALFTNEEETLFKAILLIKRITETETRHVRIKLEKQLKDRMEKKYMAESKYETFKKATFELLEAQGGGDALEALREISNAVDRLEEEPTSPAEKAITKEEIMAIRNPEQRIKLIKENMDLFKTTNNELQNKFN